MRFLLAALFLFSANAVAQTLPAFPGAEGGGALSVGGRGGIVYEVTNLNDSGPGSLRDGVQMAGARTIVFRVAGNIELLSRIIVSPSYGNLTIAGQTAPGGGITISGKNITSPTTLMTVQADNVIVRNIRFRHGKWLGCNETNCNNATYSGVVIGRGRHIIFDHCSFSWAQKIFFGTSGDAINTPGNLTLSNSIMSEMLDLYDGTGVFFLATNAEAAENLTDIDMHGNLMATSQHRFPVIKSKTTRIVNNIFYNWRHFATHPTGGVSADIISNKYLRGPIYGTGTAPWVYDIIVSPTCGAFCAAGDPSIYVFGNIGYHSSNPNAEGWENVRLVASEQGGEVGPLPEQYRRANLLPALPIPITTVPADQLDASILPLVGASRRLDCMGNWVFNRDTVDARAITDYQNNQGFLPGDEAEVGGFPVIDPGTPCTDTDSDGMPDQWETAWGLNPNDPSDRNTIHASGYTMLEMYLAGLVSGPTQLQLSGLLPASGSQLARSTNRAQLQVETTSPASCRWSHRPNVDWNNMTEYASTGQLVHSGTFPVVSGGVYQVCNRCYDSSRAEYSADSCTSFSVEVNPKFMVW
jgi:pectate lyase